MKRNSFIIMIFAFLLVFIPVSADQAFAQQSADERIIITFKERIDEELLQQEAIEVHYTFPHYHAAAITVTPDVKRRLLQNDAVKAIETDSVVSTNGQIVDWGFTEIEAAKTHKLGFTGKGVKIGIVDSGIDKTHPDLKIAGGVSFVGAPTNYRDTNGHGTHVAGIIGARDNDYGMIGVAPDAELYAIKVIDDYGFGNNSDVVQGIEWAIKNKLDIINLSITTPQKSTIMELALNNAYEKGIIIVAAAGNNLKEFIEPVDVLYPARFPTVIAVGAVDKKHKKTKFSYYGKSLEFVAPGEAIFSTYLPNSSNERYARSDGTSMAAPFVTGVAALYKEAYPLLNNQQIRTLMQTNVIDLGAPGKDAQFGYGLIQAPKVVKEIIFPDLVLNSWHEEAITSLYKGEILSGYPDGKFYPNREITRAEVVTMISRTLSIEGTQQPTIFPDVSEKHYASGYIAKATEQGIISGYPNGKFAPSEPIIRADTAVMIAEAFNLERVETPPFNDVKEAQYYTEAVHILKGLNIAAGFPDGTYQPKKKMTRAEFAVLLYKALEEYEM